MNGIETTLQKKTPIYNIYFNQACFNFLLIQFSTLPLHWLKFVFYSFCWILFIYIINSYFISDLTVVIHDSSKFHIGSYFCPLKFMY